MGGVASCGTTSMGKALAQVRPFGWDSACVSMQMGGCQNYGPLLGPLHTRCRIRIRSPKWTIILTTTQIPSLRWETCSLPSTVKMTSSTGTTPCCRTAMRLGSSPEIDPVPCTGLAVKGPESKLPQCGYGWLSKFWSLFGSLAEYGT